MAARRLVLIRHAKSAEGPIDVERPLAPRGRRDAGAIGALLAERRVPDRVVVSPAMRARQTWEGAQSALKASVDATVNTTVDDRIYDNDVDSLLAVIHDTPDQVRTLALVGHNPSLELLALELDDGAGDDTLRRALRDGFPTSAVAMFAVGVPWSALDRAGATLSDFAVPRG